MDTGTLAPTPMLVVTMLPCLLSASAGSDVYIFYNPLIYSGFCARTENNHKTWPRCWKLYNLEAGDRQKTSKQTDIYDPLTEASPMAQWIKNLPAMQQTQE